MNPRRPLPHFTLKEEIVLRVLPELVNYQLTTGNFTKREAASEVGTAAVELANATIAALEADE